MKKLKVYVYWDDDGYDTEVEVEDEVYEKLIQHGDEDLDYLETDDEELEKIGKEIYDSLISNLESESRGGCEYDPYDYLDEDEIGNNDSDDDSEDDEDDEFEDDFDDELSDELEELAWSRYWREQTHGARISEEYLEDEDEE